MVDDGRHLLGVFAHPDDEVFCAGGTFAKSSAAGWRVSVLSATRGQAGQIRDGSIACRHELPGVREAELRAACAILGVREVRVLDHVDGRLADVGPERLAADVRRVIDDLQPDALVTFGDDGAYGHPDHVTIARAAVLAAHSVGRPLSVYASVFPPRQLRMRDRLAQWLVGQDARFFGTTEFLAGLSLFASESATLGFASDEVAVRWFPPGFTIIEQGEHADSLYLILSGEVDVFRREMRRSARQKVARLGTGAFFGEEGVARQVARNADVVARTGVTCLVLSEGSSPFAGRGQDARAAADPAHVDDERGGRPDADTAIDVRDQVDNKVAAIAAHRTQYPIDPSMFPKGMLEEMFGTEYFRAVPIGRRRELLPL